MPTIVCLWLCVGNEGGGGGGLGGDRSGLQVAYMWIRGRAIILILDLQISKFQPFDEVRLWFNPTVDISLTGVKLMSANTGSKEYVNCEGITSPEETGSLLKIF